jgi:hypothetical protein
MVKSAFRMVVADRSTPRKLKAEDVLDTKMVLKILRDNQKVVSRDVKL